MGVDGVEEHSAGGVRVAWDPVRRLLLAHHTLGSQPDEAHARDIMRWVDARIGDGAFTVLVDCEGASGATVGYRIAFNRWFFDRRARMRVACYHVERLDRNLIPVFGALTGTEIRTFPSREEAERFLGLLP